MKRNLLTCQMMRSLISRSSAIGLLLLMSAVISNANAPVSATSLRLKLLSPALRQSSTPSPSPQGKPNIANEVEATPENKSGKENGVKDNNVKPNQSKLPPRHQSKPAPAPIDVTFTTDVPQSDIFLNQPGLRAQKLGTTDADGKLIVKLPRGAHNVMASRVGQRIVRQQIEVRPGNTSFNFALALPAGSVDSDAAKDDAGVNAPSDETVAKETDKDKTAISDDPHAAVEGVIKRYLDSTETDSITSSDWQLVQTQTSAELEKEPDNPRLKAQALFAQGQLAFLRGDYPNALVAFNKAVLAEPKMLVAQYGLGNAYLATNQPAEAFRAYQRAANLDPQLALAYKGSGDALTKQGKSKEALNFYEKAKSLGHISVATSSNSATNLMKRKHWSEALKELTEISKTQPTADVFVNMGDCYYELKQPLSASQAYRKATELDPKSALAAYRYGAMMYDLREYATAIESLERALALDLTGAIINRERARDMANKSAEKIRKAK